MHENGLNAFGDRDFASDAQIHTTPVAVLGMEP